MRRTSVLVFAMLTLLGVLALRPASAAVAAVPHDFNGDGHAELVIGVPLEDLGGAVNAGMLHVLRGARDGVTAGDAQAWTQGAIAADATPEDEDRFGSVFTSGDFDADGYADLAVGSPREGTGETIEHGEVHVLYGTAAGLGNARTQAWSQATLDGEPESYDRFGSALASGDLDGDGFDDLVIGVPMDDVAGVNDAGTAHVLYGSHSGLSAERAQVWSQASPGVEDEPEVLIDSEENQVDELFGSALATGDFDDDGFDDVAVGVPGESFPVAYAGGAVNVLYGSTTGLVADGDQIWSQASDGIAGTPEHQLGVDFSSWYGDRFGAALATGDTDGDGDDDLAVGVPFERIGARCPDEPPCFMGMVHLLLGSISGLTASSAEAWTQGSAGVAGAVEEGDRFGHAVAIGDVNGDGRGDLAVGSPGESIRGLFAAGAVHVLRGAASGVTAIGSSVWTQGGAIVGSVESSDAFGASIAVRNLGRSRRADLAVGVPYESEGGVMATGRVNVIYGTYDGLTTRGNQGWGQSSSGVAGAAEYEDLFGTVA